MKKSLLHSVMGVLKLIHACKHNLLMQNNPKSTAITIKITTRTVEATIVVVLKRKKKKFNMSALFQALYSKNILHEFEVGLPLRKVCIWRRKLYIFTKTIGFIFL